MKKTILVMLALAIGSLTLVACQADAGIGSVGQAPELARTPPPRC